MGISEAAKENWVGLEFANGWIIQKKLSCAEYRNIYIEQTGDTTKQIKNSHYLCQNKNCGVSTYIERTVIQRVIQSQRTCLGKCKGCNGDRINCHYSIQCRDKPLTKIPDRSQKAKIGKTFGTWEVKELIPSGNSPNHQIQALCKCTLCQNEKIISVNNMLIGNAACECFKSHSCGEIFIKQILDTLHLSYQTEYVFDGLVGIKGGNLRYDFALLNNNKLVGLIEYDGEQHYQEAGTYYNQEGQVQIHDKIKDDFAKQQNIPLIRIPYFEILQAKSMIINFLTENNLF